MTFLDKYKSVTTWHAKCQIMEIYHLAMCLRDKNWTLLKTASYFSVSVGLVSENLQLAHAIHYDDNVITCESRQDALIMIRR